MVVTEKHTEALNDLLQKYQNDVRAGNRRYEPLTLKPALIKGKEITLKKKSRENKVLLYIQESSTAFELNAIQPWVNQDIRHARVQYFLGILVEHTTF